MNTKSLLVKPKPTSVLLLLKDTSNEWYPSKLAREAGATYVYTTQLLSKFEKAGLVRFSFQGKTKMVTLTEKGVIVSTALEELVKKIEPPEQKEEKPPQPTEEQSEDRAIV